MGKRHDYRKKRKRGQKALLFFLLLLFGLGCAGLLVIKKYPDLLDTDKIKEQVRDTVMQVPEEVQELREREIPEGSAEIYEYYYQQLNESEKRMYRELLEGVQNLQESIYLSGSISEEISRAFRALEMDHSELFWIHNHAEAYQTIYPVSNYAIFEIKYLYSKEEIEEIQLAVEDVWNEINRSFSENADDYERAMAVYTYLIDEIEYVDSEHDQSLAGAFWKKECVCAGYTRAAQYLLNRMEIPCIFVSGDTVGENTSHSWNIVELDEKYYYLDATNGDQTSFLEGDATEMESHKTTLYDYFCPFPEEYESMFVMDKMFMIPECGSNEKNFYVLNQGIFEIYDRHQLYEYCCMRLENGAAVIRFKFSDKEEFEKAYEEWGNGDAVWDVAQYYLKMYNLGSVEYHIGVLEEFYTMYIMF